VVLSLTFQGGAFYGHVGPDGDDFPSDQEGAKLVARLCARGFARQLLLSHGVCCRLQLRRYGWVWCVYLSDQSAFIGRATACVSGEGEAGLPLWNY
jgi:predicted metal-dependent phosphotriesterase family hydrolase